jgi:hypothetical protein
MRLLSVLVLSIERRVLIFVVLCTLWLMNIDPYDTLFF